MLLLIKSLCCIFIMLLLKLIESLYYIIIMLVLQLIETLCCTYSYYVYFWKWFILYSTIIMLQLELIKSLCCIIIMLLLDLIESLCCILWNHNYSLEPVFLDYPADSLRRNFVGNWFVALHCMMIHYFVKCLWGCKFMGKGKQQNQHTLFPHIQLWFLIYCNHKTKI